MSKSTEVVHFFKINFDMFDLKEYFLCRLCDCCPM